MPSRMVRKLPKAATRRAMFAILAVIAAEVVGTVGFHVIEGSAWINAFYFESMLATGQGPPFPLNTDTGKIFASIMGFVSVGSVLSAFIFTLGPLVARMWREGIEAAGSGVHRLEQDARQGIQRLERDLSGEGEPKTPTRVPPDR